MHCILYLYVERIKNNGSIIAIAEGMAESDQ